MTAPRARAAWLAAIALIGLATGCSSNSGSAAKPVGTSAVNPYSDCDPLTTDQITQAVHAETLITRPRVADVEHTVCGWDAQRGPEATDITFTFTARESLQQTWQRDEQDGFRLEHLTITKQIFGATVTATGFYVRDPRDPATCAVVAAVNGTVTWRVQNHSATSSLDPCAAALDLATLTVDLSP